MGGKAAEGPDFRTVPLDDPGPVVFDELLGVHQPKGAAGYPYSIQQDGDAFFMGLFPGDFHGFQPFLIDVPQIHHQGICRLHNLFHLLRVGGHGGTSPHSQDGVGAVIHGDGMGHAVDQRFIFPHPGHDVHKGSGQLADDFPGHRYSLPIFSGIPTGSRSGTGW